MMKTAGLRYAALGLVIGILVAACAPPLTESLSPLLPTQAIAPAEDGVQVPSGAIRVVDLAIADLAARLDIDPETITVAGVEEVDWHDSSLGCPAPGMAYLTVITPGYRITLRAEGQTYDYHADQDHVVLCVDGQPARSDQGTEAQVVNEVEADLATQLGIGVEQISVVRVEPVQWPDASLGCPQPGQSYAQVITPGYLIVLEAQNREYSYHIGGSRFVLCEPQAGSESPLPTPAPQTGNLGSAAMERFVQQAKEDLGQRLNIPVEQITVLEAVAVQWRDSSLGCPEPGQAYLTVIVPGYLIKLEAQGTVYEYHTDQKQSVVYCKDPQPPLETSPDG